MIQARKNHRVVCSYMPMLLFPLCTLPGSQPQRPPCRRDECVDRLDGDGDTCVLARELAQ